MTLAGTASANAFTTLASRDACSFQAQRTSGPGKMVVFLAERSRRAASSIACCSGTIRPITSPSPLEGRTTPFDDTAGGRYPSGPTVISYGFMSRSPFVARLRPEALAHEQIHRRQSSFRFGLDGRRREPGLDRKSVV